MLEKPWSARKMPDTNINATSASDSRSFDFANLASETVARVEVYKTSLAGTLTGGSAHLTKILRFPGSPGPKSL